MTTVTTLIPYMRKSSGEDPAGSLARQRRAIRHWAEANGVELAHEVWEPGVSGSKHWRERALGEAVAAVECGDAAGIVVEEQSRLTRGRQLDVAELWLDVLARAMSSRREARRPLLLHGRPGEAAVVQAPVP